jgi:CDP-paratose 2-epimerase
MSVLVTGSNGLVGSQCVEFFCAHGHRVVGIDNDMRSYFFGEESSTDGVGKDLSSRFENFHFRSVDIRDIYKVLNVFDEFEDIELVIHTAAQPSHDWAAKEPLTDFMVNAGGTMNMLEATRLRAPNACFIFTSTNKVYGDRPNYLNLVEEEARYEWYVEGQLGSIGEAMPIDGCKHSVFGASKVSADIMTQEYGRYFGMKTGVFRGGCLTGPNHQGTELHGFLSYLIKCAVKDEHYDIYGDGKQVRDNLHSSDLVNMFWLFFQAPKRGEVYNAGGGRDNAVSILEAINKINCILQEKEGRIWSDFQVHPDEWRDGDHKWYISNLTKFKRDYPTWTIEHSLDNIIREMTEKELSCLT